MVMIALRNADATAAAWRQQITRNLLTY